MIGKYLLKYPVLVVGIILFSLFLMDKTSNRWWQMFIARYIPNTCTSIVTRIEDKVPKNWKLECPGTELLIITIQNQDEFMGDLKLRQNLYRLLANSLSQLSNYANPETMELLLHVHMNINHPQMLIASTTTGEIVSKLKKIKDQETLMLELKMGVKVKESIK